MDQEIDEVVTPELQAELVAKHGLPLRALKTKAGVVVIRLVNRATYQKYKELLFNEKTAPKAAEFVAQNATAYPDQATVRAWLDKFPGISAKMARIALEMLGQDGSEEDQGKELG
jgi:hypothetical protein